MGLFWPEQDEEHARGSLSQALYHLRGILGDRPLTGVLSPEISYESRQAFLLVTPQGIQFNPSSDYEMDVAQTSTLLAACKTHAHPKYRICKECLERYQEVARGYAGDFLDGFYLPRNMAFEEWATVVREQFHLDMMEVLEYLVLSFEGQGELDKALGYARKMVSLDDLEEAGNGHSMRLLALMGKREQALEQYAAFRQALAIQMGAEPGAETRLLYQRLRSEHAGLELGHIPPT